MSFSLTSDTGAQTGWTHFAWPIVRKLAQDFGWKPCGTQPPSGWNPELEVIGEWDGRYTSNDAQLVTAEDAAAMGLALRAALASADFEHRIYELHRVAGEQIQSPGHSVALPVDVSLWRKGLEDFAGFCSKGSFRIF